MKMKLNNEEVAAACEAIKLKYSIMEFEKANLMFSYELQGYVAAMLIKHKLEFTQVYGKIIKLLLLFKEANK